MSEVKFRYFWVSILDATGDAVDVSNKQFLDKSKYHTDIHVVEHAALAAKDVEIKQLQNELAEKDAVLAWYADPETYIETHNDCYLQIEPKDDEEMIRHYRHKNKDWIGTVVVGGKRAREVIKKYNKCEG